MSMIKRLFIFIKNNKKNLVKTFEVRGLTRFFYGQNMDKIV